MEDAHKFDSDDFERLIAELERLPEDSGPDSQLGTPRWQEIRRRLKTIFKCLKSGDLESLPPAEHQKLVAIGALPSPAELDRQFSLSLTHDSWETVVPGARRRGGERFLRFEGEAGLVELVWVPGVAGEVGSLSGRIRPASSDDLSKMTVRVELEGESELETSCAADGFFVFSAIPNGLRVQISVCDPSSEVSMRLAPFQTRDGV